MHLKTIAEKFSVRGYAYELPGLVELAEKQLTIFQRVDERLGGESLTIAEVIEKVRDNYKKKHGHN